jgi:hypothetical protein
MFARVADGSDAIPVPCVFLALSAAGAAATAVVFLVAPGGSPFRRPLSFRFRRSPRRRLSVTRIRRSAAPQRLHERRPGQHAQGRRLPDNVVRERLYGTGEELRPLTLPRGYGYPPSPTDNGKMIWMAMNHRHQRRSA